MAVRRLTDRCAECGSRDGRMVWVDAGYFEWRINPWNGKSERDPVMRLVHPECV